LIDDWLELRAQFPAKWQGDAIADAARCGL
jgi:hypothetical protein